MSLHFQRKIGAAADIKELEYIIALHQTTPRETATISSIDVHRFLQSRYALSPKAVSQSQIADLLRSLGGCDDVTLTNERMNEPQRQSTVPLSHDLLESSILAAKDYESERMEDEESLASDDVDAQEEYEKLVANQLEMHSDHVTKCQLDETMKETPTVQTISQKEQPNASYCQLE
jgi:hypothetical protein